jgi:hypothetical protein
MVVEGTYASVGVLVSAVTERFPFARQNCLLQKITAHIRSVHIGRNRNTILCSKNSHI